MNDIMIGSKKAIENKMRFIEICKTHIKRDGLDKLIEAIDNEGFFNAPCSTKYHLCVKGGLCQHSLNVYEQLQNLCCIYEIEMTEAVEETVAIISLFHDICKDSYKTEMKPVKDGQNWMMKQVYIIEDNFPCGHGEKSVIKLLQYIKLTREEILAIRWHMGAWDSAVKGGDYGLNNAQDKSIFVTLLHCADMLASHIIEK